MPQRKKATPRAAAPAPAAAVPAAAALDAAEPRRLPIDLIDPSPWNRAVREDDPGLAGLADSIREVGILQPFLVRPLDGRFQLLVGRRRMLAARLAGRSEVPVRIAQGVDDQRAEEITCIENLQRENLHFLDEADVIARLLRGTTQTALAARLGRTVAWVCRRARLATLSDRWKEQIRDPESFASRWSDAHCEAIAVLEPPAQDDLLGTLRHSLQIPGLTAKQLSRLIGDQTRTVASFPWRASDADLDPQAGACSACPCRSSRHPSLFEPAAPADDRGAGSRVPRGDRCLDPTCAARKLARHLERERERLATRHEQVLQVSDTALPHRPGALREWNLLRVTRTTAGAVPGLLVNGPQAGAVRWYRPLAPAPSPAPRPVGGKRSLADRKAQRDRQRQARAIGTLRPEIFAAEPPPMAVLVRLVIVFGTRAAHRRPDLDADSDLPALGARSATAEPEASAPAEPGLPSAPPLDPDPDAAEPAGDVEAAEAWDDIEPRRADLWHAYEQLGAADPREIQRSLWAQVLSVLIARMTPTDGVPSEVTTAWREAQHVARVLHLDAEAHLRRATEALPDPKSWAVEERAAARANGAAGAPSDAATAATAPAPPASHEHASAA